MTTVLQAAPASVLPSPLSLRVNYRLALRWQQAFRPDGVLLSAGDRATDRAGAWRRVRDEFALVLAEAFADDSDEWLLAWALAAFRMARARSVHWSTRAADLHALERAAS